MSYVDGFVIPVPKKNLPAYKRIASAAGKIWMELGALAYCECVGDDLKIKEIPASFPKIAGVRAGETVLFSWIVYKSRAHRDQVNRKVMADPRIAKMCGESTPFDFKRMAYGGFKSIVELPRGAKPVRKAAASRR